MSKASLNIPWQKEEEVEQRHEPEELAPRANFKPHLEDARRKPTDEQMSIFGDTPEVTQSALALDLRAPPDVVSLVQAREYLFKQLARGTRCPCCNQFAKRYKYKFSQNICRFLMVMYRLRQETDRFIHVTEILKHDPLILMSRDFLRPAYYGLIEEAANKDPEKKKRSGAWRLTDTGVAFCIKEITVPKYVVIYNNEVLGFEGPQMYIDDFEGEFFNYEELMSR